MYLNTLQKYLDTIFKYCPALGWGIILTRFFDIIYPLEEWINSNARIHAIIELILHKIQIKCTSYVRPLTAVCAVLLDWKNMASELNKYQNNLYRYHGGILYTYIYVNNLHIYLYVIYL